MLFSERKSYEYRHSKCIQGQNTHIFRFNEKTGRIVHVAYDPTFGLLFQFECFDEQDKLLCTLKFLNLKKA
jgi:hypothetical protein